MFRYKIKKPAENSAGFLILLGLVCVFNLVCVDLYLI